MTNRQPVEMTEHYRAMARGVRELHQLAACGKDDSPEADAIRDATDQPWTKLSEAERDRVRGLSDDLYSLAQPRSAVEAMTSTAQAELDEVYAAMNDGAWDEALDLLRGHQAHVEPALLSYLRGKIWLAAGDPPTAALFLEHAARLRPNDQHYRASFEDAMGSAGLALTR
jgi:hypothetical protein